MCKMLNLYYIHVVVYFIKCNIFLSNTPIAVRVKVRVNPQDL